MIPGSPSALEGAADAMAAAAAGFDDVAGAARGRGRQLMAAWFGAAAQAAGERCEELARLVVLGADVYDAARRDLEAAYRTAPAADAPPEAHPAVIHCQDAMVDAARAAIDANTAAAAEVRAITARLAAMQTTAPATVPPPSPPPPADPGAGAWGSRSPELADYTKKALAYVAADVFEVGGYTNAARNMRHYLANSGETLPIDPQLMMQDDPGFLRAVDVTTSTTVSDVVADAVRTGRYGEPIPFDTGWDGYRFDAARHRDWFLAVGDIRRSVTGTVVVHPPDGPGGTPRIEVDSQVHVTDRYNWDGTKSTEVAGRVVTDRELGELHESGVAREYDVWGSSPVRRYEGLAPGPGGVVPDAGGGRTDAGRSRW